MRNLSVIISLLIWFSGIAQELPPIVNYVPSEYGGANQNWMLSQDDKQRIYVANNEGLLEFNGARWTLYGSPNETIIRSVKATANKIYTGCYMEFGYWMRNPEGILEYTSLSTSLKDEMIDDEQFWNIISYDQWTLFQSLNRIYLFNEEDKHFDIVTPKNGIVKMFKVEDEIYFQSLGEGLYEIEKGKEKRISDHNIFRNFRIVNIFSQGENKIIQTENNGLYIYDGVEVEPWDIEANAILSKNSIYSCLRLNNGDYILGTISGGILMLSPDGKVSNQISHVDGLGNNTVLALFEDKDENLWLGLDNGIDCINLKSTFQSFEDDNGMLGTVYGSTLFNDKIYIGTNQGLFSKVWKSKEPFRMVSGTQGQVWSLFLYDGYLFCGHNSGTFLIDENERIKQISNYPGTWKFTEVPFNKNLLIQGNYRGLSILSKENGEWKFKNRIQNFEYSSKFFELSDQLEIFISHEYKGVFKIKVDSTFTEAVKVEIIDTFPKAKNAGMVKHNDDIFYAYKEGVFKLNTEDGVYKKDSLLSSIFENQGYVSGKLISDDTDKLWVFTKNAINYITPGKLDNKRIVNKIPINDTFRKPIIGYENINKINNDSYYVVGSSDGFFTLDLTHTLRFDHEVAIDAVHNIRSNGTYIVNTINKNGVFEYKRRNLEIFYSIPSFNKYIPAEYQYKLNDGKWSPWSHNTSVKFENLEFGKYTFAVKAREGNSINANVAFYQFEITPPWYLSTIAITFYVIGFILLVIAIHNIYKAYYKKQREKLIAENKKLIEIKELENNQKLVEIENEKLQNDIENKNRELAISTMSLIKKNEFLAQIKDELKNNDNTNTTIKRVISTINKDISEEDTWNFFKEAFNNADKDFLKKIKNIHPTLTPNDLRLCAYLRLNLSSKEIAPLLNISVRSVEIKRYRLRKKMELLHEKSLVEYILSI